MYNSHEQAPLDHVLYYILVSGVNTIGSRLTVVRSTVSIRLSLEQRVVLARSYSTDTSGLVGTAAAAM